MNQRHAGTLSPEDPGAPAVQIVWADEKTRSGSYRRFTRAGRAASGLDALQASGPSSPRRVSRPRGVSEDGRHLLGQQDGEGEIHKLDARRAFAEIAGAEAGDVEVVHVLNGQFLDRRVLFGFIRVIDPATRTAYVWGDGDTPMDFTTYADTARYTAAAAVDDNPIGRVLGVSGDILTFHELVRAYEKASGTPVTVQTLGSLDDLDQRIADLRSADPANFFAYLPLMYYRAQLNGTGKIDPVMNDRYPTITPTTVEQYVTAEGL